MKQKIVLVLHNIRSLYNVGAIFRTAEATGVDKIYLTGYSGVEKIAGKYHFSAKLKKTALEGIHMKWEHCQDPLAIISKLKNNYQIISIEQSDKSVDYDKIKFQFPVCLIVGNEVDGLPNNITANSDLLAEIPMYGKGKSLNVGVATAVVLYKIREF